MILNLDDDRLVDVHFDGGEAITARIIPQDELAALGKKHTKIKIKRGVPTEHTNDREFSKDFWDRTIESWSGFVDAKGGGIECSRDNKYKMVIRYPEIADRVREAIDEAKESIFRAEERAEKNGRNGLDGL